MIMMIPASKCNPTICLDCGARLPKFKLESKVIPYSVSRSPYVPSTTINKYAALTIACLCGAVYVWSYDETFQNGGIWKRYHMLSLFSDAMRIELTKS